MEHDKVVLCLRGNAFDVAVDLRRGSPTYGEHISVNLSSMQSNALYLRAAELVRDPQHPPATTYAVSGGQRRTLREIVSLLEEAAGRPLRISWGARPYRERDVMQPWTGTPLPGWSSSIDLLTGFRDLPGERSLLESSPPPMFAQPAVPKPTPPSSAPITLGIAMVKNEQDSIEALQIAALVKDQRPANKVQQPTPIESKPIEPDVLALLYPTIRETLVRYEHGDPDPDRPGEKPRELAYR